MGIDPDRWTGRIIEQKKGVVRLLPVAERAKDLLVMPEPARPPIGSRLTRWPGCNSRYSLSWMQRRDPWYVSAAEGVFWTGCRTPGR